MVLLANFDGQGATNTIADREDKMVKGEMKS